MRALLAILLCLWAGLADAQSGRRIVLLSGGSKAAGSLFNFLTNTATVNGVPQPNSTSKLTTVRASQGYDLAGTTLFGNNVPRRTSAGLLVEKAGQNNFTAASRVVSAWTKTNVNTVDIAGPDASFNVTTVTATANAMARVVSPVVTTPNSVNAASILVNIGTAPFLSIAVWNNANTGFATYILDPSGAMSAAATGTATVATGTAFPIGGGWFFVEMNFTMNPAGFTGVHFIIDIENVSGTTSALIGQSVTLGNYSTSDNGAGTTPASSYIPTPSGAASRAIDQVTLATPSNAASAIFTFYDNSTQTLPVPVSNILPLDPTVLSKTLIKQIRIPAPVTSYVGAVSNTSVLTNPTGTFVNISSKYTTDVFTASVSWFKILVPSWYVEYIGSTFQETNLASSYTVKASVEYPGGIFTPIAFGGVTTGSTVTPGTDLLSDQINVAIPVGATPNIWFYLVTSAGVYPVLQFPAGNSSAITAGSASPNDQTGSGGAITTNTALYGPLAIIGPIGIPSVLSVGDSRTRTNGGEVVSTLATKNIAYIQTGLFGDRAQYYATRSLSPSKRSSLQTYASHMAIGYGINDLIAGTTDAQLRTYINTIVAGFTGKPCVLSTIEADTTSTDSWATIVNQTPAIASGALETHNTWRLTVPAPFVAVWDVASITGQLNGSNLLVWKVPGKTTDGLHASAAAISDIVSSGVINTGNLRN